MGILSSFGVHNVALEAASIALSLPLLLLSPLFVLLSALIWLYREVTSRVAKWVDPSLGELLKPASAILAGDRPNSNPSCPLVIAHYLSGRLDEPTLISTFQERILSKPDLYPELRQRVVIKFGFHFWKRETCFRVGDHIRSYVDHEGNNQPGAVNSQQLMEIMEKLLAAPFQRGWSPWELILLPHFHDEAKPNVRSVLIFRGHHCLVDGLSVQSLMGKLCSMPPVYPSFRPKVPKLRHLQSKVWLRRLASIPSFYYLFVKLLLVQDRNFWTRKRSRMGSYKVGDFDVPSVELLKNIKSRYEVGMTAVINTIFISGFLKFAKCKGKWIPRATLSLPKLLPGHPDQLTNHYTACNLSVELSNTPEAASTVKLLRRLDAQLKALKSLPSSVQLTGYRFLAHLNGSLPVSLMRGPKHVPPSTLVLSNMAGPLGRVDFCGVPVEEVSAAMKPSENMSFAGFVQSYNGSFRYSVYGDEALFEQDGDLEVFLDGMKEGLEHLSGDPNFDLAETKRDCSKK